MMRLPTRGSYSLDPRQTRFVNRIRLGACITAGAKVIRLAIEHRQRRFDDQAPCVDQRRERCIERALRPPARDRRVRRSAAAATADRDTRDPLALPKAPPPAPHRTRRTSATESANGPTESSVYDNGNAPSRGTRRAVGLNPVTPHNAAGTRIEPRVSRTERHRAHAVCHRNGRAGRRTARNAPDGAVERILRRAVVRIRADDAERELHHVGAADDDRAGRAQSRHRGRVASCRLARRRESSSRRASRRPPRRTDPSPRPANLRSVTARCRRVAADPSDRPRRARCLHTPS